MPKVIVGDPHQQIYEFNGAVNGFQEVDKFVATRQTFRLTQSFRFGFEVAFAATAVLQTLKDEPMPVVGNPSRNSNIDGVEDDDGVTAVIGRTNVGVCKAIMSFLRSKDCEKTVATVANSTFNWLNSPELEALIKIQRGQKVTAGFCRKLSDCQNLDEASTLVRMTMDVELGTKLSLVKEHGSKLLDVVSQVNKLFKHKGHLRPMTDPKVKLIFTTVHGFKGQQAENVRLVEDFFFDESLMRVPISSSACRLSGEEVNLMYVALTRAKKCLTANRTLTGILSSPRVGYSFGRKVEVSQDWLCENCGLTSDLGVRGLPISISGFTTAEYKCCLDCLLPSHVNPRIVASLFSYTRPIPDYQCDLIGSILGPRQEYLDESVQKFVQQRGQLCLPKWCPVVEVNNEAESLLQDVAVMEALSRDFSDEEEVFDHAVSQEFEQDF